MQFGHRTLFRISVLHALCVHIRSQTGVHLIHTWLNMWDVGSGIWRDNNVNSLRMLVKRRLHWSGLCERQRSSVFGSQVTTSRLQSSKCWQRTSQGSRQLLSESVGGIAARRVAFAMCAPDTHYRDMVCIFIHCS